MKSHVSQGFATQALDAESCPPSQDNVMTPVIKASMLSQAICNVDPLAISSEGLMLLVPLVMDIIVDVSVEQALFVQPLKSPVSTPVLHVRV
jgi:hypothetical protein